MLKYSKLIFALLVSLILFDLSDAALKMPADDKIEGWKKKDAARAFEANDLYGHINGGAEVFLEFGFKRLFVQNYTDGKSDIGIELYEMKSAEAALGIYLLKCGKEKVNSKIGSRHTLRQYQLTALKNNYFLQVNNFSGKKENADTIVKLTNSILNQISEYQTDILKILPGRWKLEGSEGLFTGPLAIQQLYTFGEDDIFLQKQKIFGVYADYNVKNEEFTRLMIKYPNAGDAEKAYDFLLKNLDPYLNIVESKDKKLVFQDYNSQYGIARLKDELIDIRIFLDKNPVE